MSPFRNVRISHFPSLPLRECGLKFRKIIYAVETGGVTPLAGVWIEISGIRANSASPSVTPLAGVWIEIYEFFVSFRIVPSLPLRECGLKSTKKSDTCCQIPVTPLAGVWIEICRDNKCRFLCCVTPLAGVWIEITDTSAGSWQNIVTPLAGVWIEIE